MSFAIEVFISGLLNEEKVDIGDTKVDIQKLLSNLMQADIIEPVSGHGKGKYKFKD